MNIFDAVRTGELDIVNNYIKFGGDVNNTIITGSTLLMIAASYGQSDTVKILIEAGADVNAVNYDGMTALMWAVSPMGNSDVVKFLIEAKADINAAYTRSNTSGATALMFAADSGDAEALKYLIEAGSDVNAKDNDGRTALSRVSEIGHIDIIGILKAAGAVE